MTSSPIQREEMTLDEVRAFCDQLEAQGLTRISFNWGVTEPALRRGAGRPVREITGSDTSTELKLYQLPNGDPLWNVELRGPDDVEGIAWFSHDFALTSAEVVARGQTIERWLGENRDAYELFVPIRWSAAPERAKEAKAWLDANRARLEASPLAAEYAALDEELTKAIDGA